MGTFSIWHWLIVGLVIVLLFGGGKLARVMGEFGQGIKAFRKNVQDNAESDAQKLEKTTTEPSQKEQQAESAKSSQS